jgi:O-acetyl-ADP-ribose deacetylase (regulator of RNase III)
VTESFSLLTYRTGDATCPEGDGPKIIAHVCNDVGAWGRGFVVALSRRWPQPEKQFRCWWEHRDSLYLPLGQVQLVEVEELTWVTNMIGQRGIYGTDGRPPIRYEALSECLGRVREYALARNASVHMPRIGCGLAGGDWAKVRPLIVEQLCDHHVPVTVYDLGEEPAAARRRSSTRGRWA